jgi:hypothetical protein
VVPCSAGSCGSDGLIGPGGPDVTGPENREGVRGNACRLKKADLEAECPPPRAIFARRGQNVWFLPENRVSLCFEVDLLVCIIFSLCQSARRLVNQAENTMSVSCPRI